MCGVLVFKSAVKRFAVARATLFPDFRGDHVVKAFVVRLLLALCDIHFIESHHGLQGFTFLKLFTK